MKKVNVFYKARAGLFGLDFFSFDLASKQIHEHRIKPFGVYYYRYVHSMRSPLPIKDYVTPEEYERLWINEAMAEARKVQVDGGSHSDVPDIAVSYFKSEGIYGGATAKEVIESNLGTKEQAWKNSMETMLSKRSSSKEFELIQSKLKMDIPDLVDHLYSMYSDETPSVALSEYFSLVTRIRESKIKDGAIITAELPAYLSSSLGYTSIDIIAHSSVSYRDRTIKISYLDTSKEAFKVLEAWKVLAKQDLPISVYAGEGIITGINNVTLIESTVELEEVYPVAVSSNTVELHYKEKGK